jgi:hypothetical protein
MEEFLDSRYLFFAFHNVVRRFLRIFLCSLRNVNFFQTSFIYYKHFEINFRGSGLIN